MKSANKTSLISLFINGDLIQDLDGFELVGKDIDMYDYPFNPRIQFPKGKINALIIKLIVKFRAIKEYCQVNNIHIGNLNLTIFELKFVKEKLDNVFKLQLIFTNHDPQVAIAYYYNNEIYFDKTPIPFIRSNFMDDETYSIYRFINDIIIKNVKIYLGGHLKFY